MRLYDKKIIFILPMVAAMAAVSGCQPKSAAKDEQPASSASSKRTKTSRSSSDSGKSNSSQITKI